MLPAKQNKIDLSSLTDEERKLVNKYGKLPVKKGILANKSLQTRKYFDSGDYAMSQAGKTSEDTVGREIPLPENIPHSSPATLTNGITVSSSTSPTNALSASPIKESGLAKEAEFADDNDVPPTRLDQ